MSHPCAAVFRECDARLKYPGAMCAVCIDAYQAKLVLAVLSSEPPVQRVASETPDPASSADARPDPEQPSESSPKSGAPAPERSRS